MNTAHLVIRIRSGVFHDIRYYGAFPITPTVPSERQIELARAQAPLREEAEALVWNWWANLPREQSQRLIQQASQTRTKATSFVCRVNPEFQLETPNA